MRRLGFHFDASACSGCKACVLACRDRHGLPDGVRWRRVYELAGGGWTRQDGAWVNDVVAYSLSMACAHCDDAPCVAGCPTGAVRARPDGIVLVDAERCMGCRYCEWACPYGAPQYDPAAGRMTKCTFCSDDIDAGGTPACVAACPLRVLECGDSAALAARAGTASSMHPLPDPEITRPALQVTPHAGAQRAPALPVRVINAEELTAAAPLVPMRERALVCFTLAAQAAAGLAWAVAALRLFGGTAGPPLVWLLLAIGPLLGIAAAAGSLHLGSPRNAWRALANVRTSWLSREAASAAALATTWLLLVLLEWRGHAAGTAAAWLVAGSAVAGAALVVSMAALYRLRAVPAWDSPLTTAAFLLTAGSLGAVLAALLLAAGGADAAAVRGLLAAGAACVAVQGALEPFRRRLVTAAAATVDRGLFPEVSANRRGWATVLAVAAVAALVAAAVAWPTLHTAPAPARIAALLPGAAAAAASAMLARAEFYAAYARRWL